MKNGKNAYAVEMTNAAHRTYKKFSPQLKERTKEEAKEIAKDPYKNKRLTDFPIKIRCHHFNFAGSSYRIAYQVNEERKIVYIKLAHKREGFYKRLKRALGI